MSKSASSVDVDETEQAEGFELPGADLSGEELSVRVILDRPTSSPAPSATWCTTAASWPSDKGGKMVCRECAA